MKAAMATVVDGNYDDAVRRAAADADRYGWVLVSDTSWPGYELVPRHIMAGYTILFAEAAHQWLPSATPDVVLIRRAWGNFFAQRQAGSAIHSVRSGHTLSRVSRSRRRACWNPPRRRLVTLEGPLDTVMAGLSCGRPSYAAWPTILSAVDAFVAIGDGQVEEVMRELAKPTPPDLRVVAGESGACGLASLIEILGNKDLHPVRDEARIGPKSCILVNTEGATDPRSYARIVHADAT
jgi:diaminopropionate ammonia-lyase